MKVFTYLAIETLASIAFILTPFVVTALPLLLKLVFLGLGVLTLVACFAIMRTITHELTMKEYYRTMANFKKQPDR